MIFPIILIVLGLVFLAYNYGVMENQFWGELWRFWPVALIVIGVAIVGRKYLPRWLSILIIVIMIVAAILGAYYFSKNHFDFKINSKSQSQSESLKFDEPLSADIAKMNLEVALGAQNVDINAQKSGLVAGTITGNNTTPNITVMQRGDTADAKISQHWTYKTWRFWEKEEENSQISITNQIPVSITFNLGATKINADLRDIILTELNLNSGAFDGTIKLGSRSANTHVYIDSGASNIKLYVPKSSGLEVKQATGAVSLRYNGIEMMQISGEKQKKSVNFDASQNKIYVDIKAGASTIEINGY